MEDGEYGYVLVDGAGTRRYGFASTLTPTIRVCTYEFGHAVFDKTGHSDDAGLAIYRHDEVVFPRWSITIGPHPQT